MDEREQWQHWFMNQRISTSPSPYPSQQPALLDPGFLGDGSSIRQGMGSQQSSTPYPWDPSGWQALPDTQHGQYSVPSTSEASRGKRRRRSSSLDEGEHRQGYETDASGRDLHRRPARRQRVATESETNWTARGSSVLPDSRSFSLQRYQPLQGIPAPWVGGMGAAPSGPSSWSPLYPSPYMNRDDMSMASAFPSYLPQVRERGLQGSFHQQDHSLSRPHGRDTSQRGEGYGRQPVQDRVVETLFDNSQRFGGAYGGPMTINYGATYNIGNAGNVFLGTNHGNVYMEPVAIKLTDEFMRSLAEQLRICIKAIHMYYAREEETALHRGECTRGTRVDILQGVMDWATNTSGNSETVYWLSGQAGAGKTTIAYTVACHFEKLAKNGDSRVVLGGSFFCSRQFYDTRSASSIVRTIVYQLALRSKPFQVALREHGRFETVNYGPRAQLMDLLVVPWKMSVAERLADNEPCYVIPIDALDELEGAGGTEFLGTLFEVVDQQDLSGLKFFITSRAEPALVKQITSFPNKQVCRLEEVPLEQSSADIKLYLDEHLAECASPQEIRRLVSDAAGLFIYAATLVKYVKGRNVGEQKSLLRRLIPTSLSSVRLPARAAIATLDDLYLQILETGLVDPRERNDPEAFRDCLSILHTFLCTNERTSTSLAVEILNASLDDSDAAVDAGTGEGVLHRLHSVLYSQGGQVMTFHKSFADFLFDEHRSRRFFCNQEQHHCRLANGCFKIMAEQLRFNIANIPSSYHMDRDNSTLATSIDTNISVPLRYACGNWSTHLILATLEALDGLAEVVHMFLQLQVLFWVESMSLLGQRGRCQSMLRDTQQRFSKCKDTTELVSKLADAAAFAAYHGPSRAALSTPHLYLSSLATFPRYSAMVQNWRHQFDGIPGFVNAYGVGSEALVACIPVKGAVNALVVSPDGMNAAVGSYDRLLQIWDVSTGEEVRTLKGHTSGVNAVAYSSDGTHVVSGSLDESVRVWDVSTGKEVRTLKGHTSTVNAVAYSPDGTHVVSGSNDQSVRVWDVSTGEEVRILEGHTSRVNAVAYLPDGTHVVSGSGDQSVRVWDVSTGEEVRTLKGHTDWVCAVAYSPDGTHVVSGSYDQSVRVWDVSTGEEVRTLKGHTDWVRAVAYSPDGTHVASGSGDQSVLVWDVSTGEEVRSLKGHTNAVNAVAYSPDGTHVVSGSWDKSVQVWDVSTGEEVRTLKGHTSGVRAVAYSPDGTHVVSGSSDKSVRVWDVSTGEEVRTLKGHTHWVNTVAYSPDGTHVVSGSSDESVWVWDVSSGEEVRTLKGHTGPVWAVAYSPDGTHVVSGSNDKSVWVWDVSTGEEVRTLKGHTGPVWAVAYLPDGTHVVSGSNDQSVRVWDVSTGEEVRTLKGHTSTVNAVAYSPDGTHVVSGSFDKSVRVWDVSTGEEVRTLKGHTSAVNAVAYLPDGTHVVSGSGDQSVRVWYVSTGEEVRILKGHTDRVNAMACSLDGIHLASGSTNKLMCVRDISPEHAPRYIRQHGPNGECTGWLVSPNDPSAYLMFVRPEALLPDDSNVLTIPTSAVPHLDLSNAKLGPRWAQCYTPRLL